MRFRRLPGVFTARGAPRTAPASVASTRTAYGREATFDRWRCFSRLLRLLWVLSRRAMAVNGAVTVLLGLAPLLSLVVLRHLVDAAARVGPGGGGAGWTRALVWAAAYVVVISLQETCWDLGRLLRDRAQEQLKAQIQERVIAKAQALPLATFEQAELFNQLQRIERGLDNRFFSTMAFIFQVGTYNVTIVALLVYVGSAHASLPVILTVGTLLSLLFRVRISRERFVLERKQTEPQRRLDYLAGLMAGQTAAAEVRLFALRDHLLDAWTRLYDALRDDRLALVRREARFEGASSTGQSVTFGIALMVVVALMTRGRLTVGQYAAFVGVVQQFQESLWGLLWNFALIDNDLRYIRDFFLYLDLPEAASEGDVPSRRPRPLPEREGEAPAEPGGGERAVRHRSAGASPSPAARQPRGKSRLRHGIVFEGVSFAYPDSDQRVLGGIDLQIRPGERIALVGVNGAGKTTLAKLLLGLYRPTEGCIVVDGADLAGIDPASWRRRTAAVFQDFQQYHLTVRENIAFGNSDRMGDEAAIEGAARLAGADRVIATLPQGLETALGKEFAGGVELSLGQWQKIAVARAYLRDAEVLVLDEPTAALDAKAEVEIYRQFRDVSAGKTVLLISHRLGSARLADRILVLDGGRICAEGTHAALIEEGGLYARMLGTQAQWYS